MSVKKLISGWMLSLLVASTLFADTTIISYKTGFAGSSPKPGWFYLTNSGGPLGTQSSYTELAWDADNDHYRFGTGTWPAISPNSYASLKAEEGHPGEGIGQNGNVYPHYAIAAYRVQEGEGGMGRIINSHVERVNVGYGDGCDVAVYVNDTLKKHIDFSAAGPDSSGNFDCDLGILAPGDTVFFALGPGSSALSTDGADATRFGYQIAISPVPEPPPGLLMGAMVNGRSTAGQGETPTHAVSSWKLGTPIVTYYAGPQLTHEVAQQMVDGGWNLVWCDTEQQLDIACSHGLRAQLHSRLVSPATLDNPFEREKLDALIARVRNHRALYSYFIVDEPSAKDFAGLDRLVGYLRERDPDHLAYINLFPVYATNEELGFEGDPVTAYRKHLREYIGITKPSLLSYDHYHFASTGDGELYFLNLAMVRDAAKEAGTPFLNIVQAAAWPWVPEMRVPTGDEMRFLVYTTLAYGAQGISYYVYHHADHTGGIALANGSPTPLYHALKPLNRQFVAIASELQPLDSLGVYHAGMMPPGTTPLPTNAAFRFDPPLVPLALERPASQGKLPSNNGRIMKPVKGLLIGAFGPIAEGKETLKPTHALVVNLDYKAEQTTTVVGPEKLEIFDATARTWSPVGGDHARLRLPPGGGVLVRCQGVSGVALQEPAR